MSKKRVSSSPTHTRSMPELSSKPGSPLVYSRNVRDTLTLQDDPKMDRLEQLRRQREAKVAWYVKISPLKPSPSEEDALRAEGGGGGEGGGDESHCDGFLNDELAFYCDTFVFKPRKEE